MNEKNSTKNTVDQTRELDDNQLDDVAGAGASGGPICPSCGSYKVVIDPQRRLVVKCLNCGYQAK